MSEAEQENAGPVEAGEPLAETLGPEGIEATADANDEVQAEGGEPVQEEAEGAEEVEEKREEDAAAGSQEIEAEAGKATASEDKAQASEDKAQASEDKAQASEDLGIKGHSTGGSGKAVNEGEGMPDTARTATTTASSLMIEPGEMKPELPMPRFPFRDEWVDSLHYHFQHEVLRLLNYLIVYENVCITAGVRIVTLLFVKVLNLLNT